MLHRVGVDRGIEPRFKLGLTDPDLHRDGLGTLPQPVEVLVEEGNPAAVNPQPFPHPVAQHEPAVEHRDCRRSARYQRSIDVD